MSVQLTTFIDPQKTALTVSTINDVPNSKKKTLSFPDGSVVSCQEDGSIQDRLKGADGPFEQCDIDGQVATYWYTWQGKDYGPFAFAFFKVTGKS